MKIIKLSKRAWIYIAIGIFVILCTSLGVAYVQQSMRQSRLNQELSFAQLMLAKQSSQALSSQHTELESRLAQTESQLEDAKVKLDRPVESIEVTDALFDLARDCGVDVTQLRHLELSAKMLEELDCSVLSLMVEVEGDVPELIKFVLELSGEFPTGIVDSAIIDVPRMMEEEEEGPGKPSASLRLSLYSHEGDQHG